MKYEKAMVTMIDLGEEEILTSSGCASNAYIAGEACGNENSMKKYVKCHNNQHMVI